MKITYRREMKHNYMIIEPEEAEAGFDRYMLAANSIEGLLKFYLKRVDNQDYYYYEITSRQPLSRILEYQSLGAAELSGLIGGISQVLGRLEAYLLKEDQILLEPEYIYVEPERFRISLCLVPGRRGNFPEEMTGLLQYLLGKVNHQDKECVVMAYGMYQESLKENYGMSNILEILGRNGERGQEETERFEREQEELKEGGGVEAGSVSEFGLEEDREAFSDSPKEGKDRLVQGGWALILGTGAAGAAAGLLWLFWGIKGLEAYWYGVLGLGAAVFSVVWLITARGGQKLSKETEQREHSQWQMTFEEPQEKESVRVPEESPVFQTVLLTGAESKGDVRCLKSFSQETEDIAIPYVPFLIGKQEGVADYVLNKETVSRIHVKIDRQGEEYVLTDLNSTNGTAVNGRMLETNETVLLKKGDEVFIANFAFIFT